jgi:predicted ferric reductase
MIKQKWLGFWVSVFVGIFPVFLWYAFSTIHSDSLAKITALSALSLLSFLIILSARLPFLEGLFYGLDRLYKAHKNISAVVIMLLLAHSALLTFKYLKISDVSAFKFVIPSTEIPLLLGKIALYVMVALVVLTLYFKIKYQWFVLSMRVMGAMIFLSGYHALFVTGSDLSQNMPLQIYMIAIGAAASLVYVYRSLFHKAFVKSFEYKLESITKRNNVFDIVLTPTSKPINRYAGQFAFVTFQTLGDGNESHPFTIASASTDEKLRFGIKNLGDFTSTLGQLKIGDHANIEGPYGFFSFTKIPGKKQTWIAGGIGVTPFLAMAQSLPASHIVNLYYCVKNASEAVFLDDLLAIAESNPRFTVTAHFSDTTGPIKVGKVFTPNNEEYLLCGPPGMMQSLERNLLAVGAPKQSIHYEEFAL